MHSPRRCVESGRCGFTLIELLVVVAIIALLVSILLPSLNGARRQGRQLQCLTNLSSIGKASLFYAQEYKGWVIGCASEDGNAPRPGNPVGYPRNDSHAHTQFAISLLNGLLYDHSVKGLYRYRDQRGMIKACGDIPQLQCPSFPNPAQKLDFVVNGFVQDYPEQNCRHDQDGLRFRDNNRVYGEGTDYAAYFHHIDRFKAAPSRRIYIIEASRGHATDNLVMHDTFYATHLPFAGNPRMNNDRRHPKGTNALFFDGHAERMDFARVDAGWPNTLGVRLRWFTDVPERYR
jgi:prepilin-type N-terminal cleavage/methylation domain-containing protein/prepilin-type processing-associated H-X9-DG protein